MGIFQNITRDVSFVLKLRRLLKQTEAITPETETTLADDLETSIDRYAGNLAFIFEGRTLSFGELDAAANRIGHWAVAQGFKAGDVVALDMENTPEFVACWYGLSKVGVVTALINTQLEGHGLAHCVNIVGAKAIIAAGQQAAAVQAAANQFEGSPSMWDYDGHYGEDFAKALVEQSDARPDRAHRASLRGGDLCMYVYTSGTTGLPKAAKLTHMRTRRAFRLVSISGDITAGDRIYNVLPLYHVTGGYAGMGGALLTGATTILRRKFSASAFWDDVVDHEATCFAYIGELCRYLVNQPDHPRQRDHKLRMGFGNGLRPDVWEKFYERFGDVKMLELYGSTEGNVILVNLDGKMGAVGRLPRWLDGSTHVRFVKFDYETEEPLRGEDGFCMLADVGEAGEAIGQIKDDDSSTAFAGYQDKNATSKKILQDVFEKGDKWFRTGDLLSRDKEGYVYFVDRIGDTYRWKGENVSTNEVAEIFSAYEGIHTANVYGVQVPHTDGKAGMAAITSPGDLDMHGLYEHLRSELPSYALPLFIRVQPEAETTGTFKYRKVDLVNDGFDPSVVGEPIYFADPDQKTYAPLTAEAFAKIQAGEMRL